MPDDNDSRDDASEEDTPFVQYTARKHDRDLSHGMDHHLRWPVSIPSSGSKRSHPRNTSDHPVAIPPVVPPPLDGLSPSIPRPDPPTNTRVLRPRTTLPTTSKSLVPVTRPRIPVAQRWAYVLVPEPRPYTFFCDVASSMPLVCQLSSHQSNLTQHDLASAHCLLNYVSSHRNPHKTIHPSSMALWACTDASLLS